MIYVSPFTLAAMLIGSNADTNWGGILIGVLIGCVASYLLVALRKVAKAPGTKAVLTGAPVQRSPKVVTGKWRDITGREVGDSPQLEAPRSIVVANEKGVVRK